MSFIKLTDPGVEYNGVCCRVITVNNKINQLLFVDEAIVELMVCACTVLGQRKHVKFDL